MPNPISEFTARLREQQLEQPLETSGCAICNIKRPNRRASARSGIAWFKQHQQTRGHQRALRRREQDGK